MSWQQWLDSAIWGIPISVFQVRSRLTVQETLMDEIRVAWHSEIEHESGVFQDGGQWYVDAIEIRKALDLIIWAQNRQHGEESHWLERRTVPDTL
jgi:hypothetical protein